jgi:hypothetical protein
MNVEEITSETGLKYRQFIVPARNPEIASGEMFAARIIDGSTTLEVQWTESLGRGTFVNRLAQAQALAGGAGSITRITGLASATLEVNIVSGRLSAATAADTLSRRLGGTWKIEITPPRIREGSKSSLPPRGSNRCLQRKAIIGKNSTGLAVGCLR